MDKNSLVNDGIALIEILDKSRLKPRAAMWVYNSETERWRLWIVPSTEVTDKLEFYRILAGLISENRDKIPGLDISDIEFKKADHPAVSGMSSVLRMEGLGSAHFSNNRFNGFYLPDGIVLRMAV
jgi:hypothetical protein